MITLGKGRGRAVRALLASAPLAWGVSACGPDAGEAARTPLSLVAASSLTELMRDVERGFEAVEPSVDLRVDFAGSQVLRLQIEQGLDVDLFASADVRHLRALVASGAVRDVTPFASNRLAIAVPASNPAGIGSIEDLVNARSIVVGTEESPIGGYTLRLWDRLALTRGRDLERRIRDRVVSEESNVRLARSKVALGEADAAIVYLTDVTDAPGVRAVPIPDDLAVGATYHLGVLASSRAPELAERFRAYLTSEEGARLLRARGFDPADR